MKNNFIPYHNRILIEPISRESLLNSSNESFEMGKVIAVGSKVSFCKIGDTVFFAPQGCEISTDDKGNQYYVLSDDTEFIYGKYSSLPVKKNASKLPKK